MINFDDITKGNIKEDNLNWPQTPDHSHILIMIGCSGSGKTNSLFNLMSHQPDIYKMYLHAKDLYEAKFQKLINTWKITSLKYLNDSKDFIDYSNDMDDIYKNIEEYNPNKKNAKYWSYLMI